MPQIYFNHTQVTPNDLVVETGANQISWSYRLNTQAYPTYAGEVVQVLSTNIDDLEITGEVKSYGEMEAIYSWFLQYMLRATQGYAGDKYNETPVIMKYPERGWTLAIKPIQMPGMRYGRDVVIPQWRLRASIVDPDPEMDTLAVEKFSTTAAGQLAEVGTMTADIGYRRKNPFSDPNALITKEEAELYPRATSLAGISVIGEEANPEQAPKELTGVARIMSEQFETLMGGQFSELADHMDFGGSQPSKPANTSKQNNDPNKADTAKPGKTKGSHGDVR